MCAGDGDECRVRYSGEAYEFVHYTLQQPQSQATLADEGPGNETEHTVHVPSTYLRVE